MKEPLGAGPRGRRSALPSGRVPGWGLLLIREGRGWPLPSPPPSRGQAPLGWAKPTAVGWFRKRAPPPSRGQAQAFGLAALPSPLRSCPQQRVNPTGVPLVSPNPAIGHWSGSERLMDGSFRGRRSSPAKGFGLPPTPDLIRGRKPQRWGGAPAGFARGAGPRRARRRFGRLGLRTGERNPWPSPSKRQCLPPVNLNHSRSHPHFNPGIWA